MTKVKLFLLVVLLWVANPLQATVILPAILADNMVLQQHKSLPIWGFATAGEEITVSFGSQNKKTTANRTGHWEVVLDPLKASFKPAIMTISGTNSIQLKNILVGEVWLCSGQSNMVYSMNKSSKYADAVRSKGLSEEELKKISNPNMRVFLVKRSLYENNEVNRGWEEADYEALKDFSAAGYFFGQRLYETLNVPVGIISSAVSASAIERWAPQEVFAQKAGFNPASPMQPEEIDDLNDGKFYYGMIQPLAPFALAGFLWYQGETNCFKNEAFEYTDKMQALINTWRSVWRDDGLPFYYVQIAPFYYSQSKGEYQLTEETLPRFWEAQSAALQIPHTGMVVTTDLVDNLEDIHPTYKWAIGRRLAGWALANSYGKKNVVYSGPMFKGFKIKKDKIIIEFSQTGTGLVSHDGKPLNWFELAGEDGEFIPAEAIIKGKKVIVSSPKISSPVSVRFAWDESAQPNLFNKEGLPAAPFRSNAPSWTGGQKHVKQ